MYMYSIESVSTCEVSYYISHIWTLYMQSKTPYIDGWAVRFKHSQDRSCEMSYSLRGYPYNTYYYSLIPIFIVNYHMCANAMSTCDDACTYVHMYRLFADYLHACICTCTGTCMYITNTSCKTDCKSCM